jgi:predicted dehydrogenase
VVYQIGIIGAGFLTRHRLVPLLSSTPGLRLAAVLDNQAETLSDIAGICPDAVLTCDEDEFFGTRLDMVHVATPNHLHQHFTCRALGQGIATVVEKPIAHTVASAERITAAAARTGTAAIIGYMAKHNAYNQRARELVASGAIGVPLSMTATRLGWRKDDWRSHQDTSGLGCLADLGIYPVLTAVDIFGTEPVRYEATAWPVTDPDLTDIYAQATLWFDDRRYLHFETSATFNEEPASAEVSMYTIVGDSGIIQVSGSWAMNGGGSLQMRDRAGWREIRLDPVNPYLAQYNLLAACSAGEPVPSAVSLGRGLADLKILYSIADSAIGRAGPAHAEPARRQDRQPVAVR